MVVMKCSWNSLWTAHSELNALIDQAKASDLQRRFLGELSPMQVPALGFEISKKGVRRLPQMAAMLITDRPRQFQITLERWLHEDSIASSGVTWDDVADFISLREGFQSDIWIEWPKPQREGSRSVAFMLFRRPSQGWIPQRIPQLLVDLQTVLAPSLRAVLLNPSEAWWTSLMSLPLGSLDQLGIDFSCKQPQWRFLFNIQDHISLLAQLGLSQSWQRCLEPYPLQFSCSSNSNPLRHCGLEVLPLYRKSWSVTNYPGPVPADATQWPVWPHHPSLLPQKRLNAWVSTSVHLPRIQVGAIDVGVRGGLSHQKLVLESGLVVDHKAYLGCVITRPLLTPVEHAIDHICKDQVLWKGFDLAIGSSDVWIPIACATLLGRLQHHPRVGAACRFNLHAVEDLLVNPIPVGYGRDTPADLDSTLWLMRCLAAYRMSDPVDCEHLLVDMKGDDGTFPTYAVRQLIANFIRQSVDQVAGWCSQHDCVMVNLAASSYRAESAQALAWLRRRLRERSFVCYWWPLKTMVLTLLPRGCLPRSIVRSVMAEDYSANVKAVIPESLAQRSKQFFDALFALRHGTVAEQDVAESSLHQLIRGPSDFSNLVLMQLPDPWVIDPAIQEAWIFDGSHEGAIAPERHGFFAAAMLLDTMEHVGRFRSDSCTPGNR